MDNETSGPGQYLTHEERQELIRKFGLHVYLGNTGTWRVDDVSSPYGARRNALEAYQFLSKYPDDPLAAKAAAFLAAQAFKQVFTKKG